jgi:ParB family transcriptional regulator, chromosome partitioning protein
VASGKKKGLGRGLEVLLGSGSGLGSGEEGAMSTMPLAQLQPGRYQPRRIMDEQGLEELTQSIREQGVLQPILVRPLHAQANGPYEIIAGERRFQAAKRAGLADIPVIIKPLDDQAALAVALIENLQRQDLSALEEAQGISRLIEEFGLTHDQAAQAVGRSRSATTNLLRLLSLPSAIQAHLEAGRLEAGHARALLALPAAQQRALAESAVAQRMSVRQVEQQAKRLASLIQATPRRKSKASAQEPALSDWQRMEQLLSDHLGLETVLKSKATGSGELVVRFSSPAELDGLLHRLLPADTMDGF